MQLAFRAGEETGAALDAVQSHGMQALFLFTVDQLAGSAPLLRRLISSGQSVGLILTGADPETCLTELEQGRALLAALTCTGTAIVSAGQLTQEGQRQLEDAGCVLWRATINGDGYTAAAIAGRLRPERTNRVELICGEGSSGRVNTLLRLLSGEEYRLTPALVSTL